jgi:hypothetical protein
MANRIIARAQYTLFFLINTHPLCHSETAGREIPAERQLIERWPGTNRFYNVGVLMFFNYDSPGDGFEEILERLFEMGASAAGG